MKQRDVRPACARKADNKRNAPKFLEWERVRVEEQTQRTTAAHRCMFLSKVKPFLFPLSSVSFELSLRICIHLGLGFRKLHELLFFFFFSNILQLSHGCTEWSV